MNKRSENELVYLGYSVTFKIALENGEIFIKEKNQFIFLDGKRLVIDKFKFEFGRLSFRKMVVLKLARMEKELLDFLTLIKFL